MINWGNKDAHRLFPQALNSSTEEATDKLRFFRALQGSDITPAFWTNADEIPNDAFPIVCRTILNGHSGRGIVIADSRDQLVRAPLYTQYVKKQAEFRIHLGRRGNEYVTIAEQRKVRDPNVEVTDWRIRNHDSGFIFQRQGIEVPASVRDVARLCIEALRLDFGAVDVIYNVRQRRAYVLEINTAPGLEGQTVEDYASFFRSL
ncbi:hypothetical protein KGP36_03095 [Patescibacteria group bacterium]|nr:hypothetical protein [Patescibacteria group bacterium]